MYSKLQYISQGETAEEQEAHISNALQQGADWIQLRWKQGQEQDLLNLSLKIKKHCAQYRATFIVNDHVDLAKEIDADGVHLGLTDTSVLEARLTLGSTKIIGGTANTILDIEQRIAERCNYIGLGPLRFTSTKEKLSPILGFTGFERIMQTLKSNRLPTPPLYAIGGIRIEDLSALQKLGIYGVALSTVLTEQPHLIHTFKATLQCPHYK